MTIVMCLTWVVLFGLTLVAFYKGKIFISAPKDVLRDMVGVKDVDDVEREEDEKDADKSRVTVQVAMEDDLERGLGGRASDERTVAERPDASVRVSEGMFPREAA